MRMAGPDIVLLVVGALLFGGAATALVSEGGAGALGGGASALGAFTVTYQTNDVEVDSVSVSNYANAQAAFDVTQEGVTQVVIRVACTDPVPGGTFNLQVQVEGPNGIRPNPKSGACGTAIVFEIPIAQVPPETTALGATEEEARNNHDPLAADNATRAVGAWNVAVQGARGSTPTLPAGQPSGSITLTVTQWEATYTPVQR